MDSHLHIAPCGVNYKIWIAGWRPHTPTVDWPLVVHYEWTYAHMSVCDTDGEL